MNKNKNFQPLSGKVTISVVDSIPAGVCQNERLMQLRVTLQSTEASLVSWLNSSVFSDPCRSEVKRLLGLVRHVNNLSRKKMRENYEKVEDYDQSTLDF